MGSQLLSTETMRWLQEVELWLVESLQVWRSLPEVVEIRWLLSDRSNWPAWVRKKFEDVVRSEDVKFRYDPAQIQQAYTALDALGVLMPAERTLVWLVIMRRIKGYQRVDWSGFLRRLQRTGVVEKKDPPQVVRRIYLSSLQKIRDHLATENKLTELNKCFNSEARK